MDSRKFITQDDTGLVTIKQVNSTSPVDLRTVAKKHKHFKYLYEDGTTSDVYVIPNTRAWLLWDYSDQPSEILHITSEGEDQSDHYLYGDRSKCSCGVRVPKSVKIFSAMMGIK